MNKEYHEISNLTKEEVNIFRDEFWEEYICIPKEERIAYERKYFPTFTAGLPQWFMSRKLYYEEKEIEAELKQQKNKKKEHKENLKDNLKDNEEGYIQLKLL